METEKQIAERLAQKVNQPDPTPPPVTKDPEPNNEDGDFHNNLPLENLVAKQQLLDYLEVPQVSRHAPEIAQWADEVLAWAKEEAKSNDLTDILQVIHDQERALGTHLKPDRLLKLRQFIKIRRQRMQLEQRERMMYE